MIHYGRVLYDEEIEVKDENSADDQQLAQTIEKLNVSVEKLNQNLEKYFETSEEEIDNTTEAIVDTIPEEEQPLQKKDMNLLIESVDSMGKSVDSLVRIEQENQNVQSTDNELGLHVLDETVDTHLYLTSEVENASLDDLYTIGLSIRNVLVLAFLIGLSFFFLKLVRTGLERMLNR